MNNTLNILVSGDKGVGKRTIINTFMGGFRINLDNLEEEKTYQGRPMNIHLFTENVWNNVDRMKDRYHVDTIFIVLDASNLIDFNSTYEKICYFRVMLPDIPFVMILNKCDNITESERSLLGGRAYRFHQTHKLSYTVMASYTKFIRHEDAFNVAMRMKSGERDVRFLNTY